MIKTHVFIQDGVIKDVPVESIKKYLRNKKATVWVDIESPTEEEYDLVLRDIFSFHPLSIEDCKKPLELPKVDVFDEHIFLVLHNVSSESQEGYFKKAEVDFFLGENFLVSVHLHKSKTIEYLMQKVANKKRLKYAGKYKGNKNGKKGLKTADFLLYQILDNFVDRYFPLLDIWEDEVEDIELKILTRSASSSNLNKLMSIKRELLNMRKSMMPQRDVLKKMTRDDFPFIRKKTMVYFKDVYDHILVLSTELEIQRDLINSALEANMSVISNEMTVISARTNEVMHKLTIITTIFMPLTFITGLYGMNFTYLPGADSPLGFFVLSAAMGLIVLLTFSFFKRKKWV